MRLSQIAPLLFEHFLGRLLRRAAGFALLGLLAIFAVYHFTVAGTLALEAEFGALTARLIIASVYIAGGLITLGVLYATRSRPLFKPGDIHSALGAPRKIQLAVLVEAVMLGYALSRDKAGAKD